MDENQRKEACKSMEVFLRTCEPGRSEPRADHVCVALAEVLASEEHDICSPEDLVNLSFDDLKGGNGKVRRLCKAAIDFAPKKWAPSVALASSASNVKPKESDTYAVQVPLVHIDLEAALEKVTLERVPRQCFPSGKVVDDLATDNENERKKEVLKPFIHVSLDKYLPAWAKDTQSEKMVSDSDEETQNKSPKKKRKLTFLEWISAFDNYALAAAATN